jgi:hypothetical protein
MTFNICKRRFTTRLTGLDENIVRSLCDPAIYGNKIKHPFINYLPFTTPSQAYIDFVSSAAMHDFRQLWTEDLSIAEVRQRTSKFGQLPRYCQYSMELQLS